MEAALAVAAIGIGVGLSTAMFSILWGTLLRGLPFRDSDRLVRVESTAEGESVPATATDFLAWRRRQTSFEGIAAWLGGSFNFSRQGELAERWNGAYVSANTFRLLHVRPFLGRDFREEDEVPGAALVAILGAHLFKERFQEDPSLLGTVIRLNGRPAQVIGVMPEGFGFPLHQEVWTPLPLAPAPNPQAPPLRVQVFGKLKEGESRRRAEAELAAMTDSSPVLPRPAVRVTPFVEAYTEDLTPTLYLLFGASLGLLLVVCANLSALLYAQTLARLPELAVRSAIGATRSRLVLQLLAETAVLTGAGTLLSLPLAAAAIRAYLSSQGGELRSFWMDVRLDPASLGYALAIAAVASIASTVPAAVRVTGPRLNEVLKRRSGKGAARRPGALSGVSLVVQLGLSLALLASTGLVITSLGRLGHLDFGFAPQTVLTAQLLAPPNTYPTAGKKIAFFLALEQKLDQALGPGRAAFVSALPGNAADAPEIEIEGQALLPGAERPTVQSLTVSGSYFELLHMYALEGRLLTGGDQPSGEPVVVVNRSFSRRFFGYRSPLGSRLRLDRSPAPWRTIVGVVPDFVMGTAPTLHPEGVYLPLAQEPTGWMAVLVRTPGPPLRFSGLLKRTVSTVDPELPIFWVATLAERRDDVSRPQRTMAQIFLTFGGAALLLSLLGIYGVASQSVKSRSAEMAIRLALGARRRDLLRLLLRVALRPIVAGAFLGAAISLATSRFLTSQLFGVRGSEPGELLAGMGLVILVGALACFFPAAKVLMVQPADALRED
jgi:predicted permease